MLNTANFYCPPSLGTHYPNSTQWINADRVNRIWTCHIHFTLFNKLEVFNIRYNTTQLVVVASYSFALLIPTVSLSGYLMLASQQIKCELSDKRLPLNSPPIWVPSYQPLHASRTSMGWLNCHHSHHNNVKSKRWKRLTCKEAIDPSDVSILYWI